MRLSMRTSLAGLLMVSFLATATAAYGSSTTPSAPRAVHAQAANASARVTWLKPVRVGSSPITKYVVSSHPGTSSCSTSALNCTVTGLKNGTVYRFSVVAVNRSGAGLRSPWSNPVKPTAVIAHRRVLVVTPSKRLHNGQKVMVSGSGFTPKDAIYLVECLANAKGQNGCKLPTSIPTPIIVTATGQLPATTFTVTTGTIGNGTCGTTATNAASCAVSAGNATGGDSTQTVITFQP